jgi:cell division control protein 45
MILQLENWYLGYSQILNDCRPDDDGSTGSTLILCNADVDAMAAGRILSYMLRNDGVSHQLLPCMSYPQLISGLSRHCSDDVRAVVLLNLGANRNLTRLFDSEPYLDPSIKVYVMDCRRPVHLANVYSGNNVVVFWDVQNDEELPSDGDNLSGTESSSSSEDDDDEEDEESSDDEGDGEHEFEDEHDKENEFGEEEDDLDKDDVMPAEEPARDVCDEQETDYDGEDEKEEEESPTGSKRRKTKEASEGGDDEVHDDKSMEDKDDAEPSETQQSSLPTMTPRELHQDRRNRLRMYYSTGSFYGSPVAFVAWTVATQLRFQEVGDLLWLACVGITDAYLHARLDVSGYSTLAMQLRNTCHRLFPNDDFHRVSNTVYAENLLGGGSADHQTRIGFSGNGRVLSESDFRLFMLRHTSLFDALVYSDFISTRFQLSTSRGMHRLQEMLAKMGYPLEECHQPFAFMKPSLRRQLQDKFREHAEEYGLTNFEFTSFFRVTGYQSLLSASDTSYAVTALLECETPESEEDDISPSFNIAYDALNSNAAPAVSLNGLSGEGNNLGSLVNGGNLSGHTGLGAGIRLAMSLQRTIMATAASLMERTAITRLSHFRYAYISCTSQGESAATEDALMSTEQEEEKAWNVFSKPLALMRLAHYLMDLHRENGKWVGSKARPLILMAEKPATKTYLVVGYEYPDSPGDLVKNRFGKNFELAAQSMKGTFRFDSFDSNVVEVARGDVQRFIEQLHYLMDSL